MRTVLGISIATALALVAGGALADEASGKIENIDLSTQTITVGDKTFQWSSENSMGVKLKELKEGEQVKILYEQGQNGHNDIMDIKKEK